MSNRIQDTQGSNQTREVLESPGFSRGEKVNKLLDEVSFQGGTPAEKLH